LDTTNRLRWLRGGASASPTSIANTARLVENNAVEKKGAYQVDGDNLTSAGKGGSKDILYGCRLRALQTTGSGQTSVISSTPFSLPAWKAIATVLILTFAVYVPTLRYQFVHDDRGQIVENPAVHSWHLVPTYFTSHVWAAVMPEELGNYYRPIFLLWLRINDVVFGNHAWGWHLTTILAHLLTTLLVYFLALRFGGSRDVALLAALIFGLHPAHIEAVAWISGVTEPLLGVLLLASFLSYARWRRQNLRKWRLISLLLFALALGEKETGLILPALLVAYDWIFEKGSADLSSKARSQSFPRSLPSPEAGEREPTPESQGHLLSSARISPFAGMTPIESRGIAAWCSGALRGIWPFFLLTVLYIPARIYALKGFSHAVTPLSIEQLAFTWPSLIWFWIRHLIWPAGLSTFYNFPAVVAPTLKNFTLPGIFDVCVAVALFAGVRQSCMAAISAAWLVLPLIPLLDLRVFVADDFAHDRYLYLPSVGLSILIALVLKKVCRGAPQWQGISAPLLVAALCLAAALSYGTITQCFYFHDNLTFYAYNHSTAPHNPNAESNYATVLAERGLYGSALEKFSEVVAHNPNYWTAVYDLGLTYYKIGNLPEAEEYFFEAIRINPHKADEYFYLGMTWFKAGQPHRAIASVQHAIAINHRGFAYHFALGVMLKTQGDLTGALREFKEELAVDPEQQAVAAQVKEIEDRLRVK
jgi:tetratricopeptide (TPR) repeat protein